MRNVDKIKSLKHELGRHRKKVADQEAQIGQLKELVQKQVNGARELGRLMDAILAAVACQHGTVVEDIGYNLELDDFAVDRMLDRFQVHAQRRGSKYIIGVERKEENDNDRSDETEA